MKIAVIGANGNLGSRITRQALDRGHDVKSVIYQGENVDDRAEMLNKSLFDLNAEDINNCDVVISAFGGGFKADPAINKEAFLKYIELMKSTNVKFIAIGGAGSLYTDSTCSMYEFEKPGYNPILKEMSRNIKLGIDELKKTKGLDWTVVCPSRFFDPDGPFTKNYRVGENEVVIFNDEDKSYVTYDDLAYAMLDIAESGKYREQKITVTTIMSK